MPTAPVNDDGAVLYFEDTGPPVGCTQYTTLVLIHGMGFHGGIFRPMVPFAAAHRLRLVLVNMRDYPGSTPYTPAELETLRMRSDAGLRARGRELAAFLAWCLETARIPPIPDVEEEGYGAGAGGLVVVAWSAGNSVTLPMFAHSDGLLDAQRALIGRFLRTYVVFDPSPSSVGTHAPGVSALALDGGSFETYVARVCAYVSAHYPDLEALPAPGADTCRPALAHPPLTTTRMPPDALCAEVLRGSQKLICGAAPAVYRAIVERALLNEKGVWPAVRVQVVWCAASVRRR